MVSKNNHEQKMEAVADRKPHFAIRKLTIGAASVLLGTSLWMSTSASMVHADEADSNNDGGQPETDQASTKSASTGTVDKVVVEQQGQSATESTNNGADKSATSAEQAQSQDTQASTDKASQASSENAQQNNAATSEEKSNDTVANGADTQSANNENNAATQKDETTQNIQKTTEQKAETGKSNQEVKKAENDNSAATKQAENSAEQSVIRSNNSATENKANSVAGNVNVDNSNVANNQTDLTQAANTQLNNLPSSSAEQIGQADRTTVKSGKNDTNELKIGDITTGLPDDALKDNLTKGTQALVKQAVTNGEIVAGKNADPTKQLDALKASLVQENGNSADNYKTVTDFSGLQSAINDTNVSGVNISGDITANGDLNINRTFTIKGADKNATLNFSSGKINNSGNLTLDDITVNGAIAGHGTVNIKGTVNSNIDANNGQIAGTTPEVSDLLDDVLGTSRGDGYGLRWTGNANRWVYTNWYMANIKASNVNVDQGATLNINRSVTGDGIELVDGASTFTDDGSTYGITKPANDKGTLSVGINAKLNINLKDATTANRSNEQNQSMDNASAGVRAIDNGHFNTGDSAQITINAGHGRAIDFGEPFGGNSPIHINDNGLLSWYNQRNVSRSKSYAQNSNNTITLGDSTKMTISGRDGILMGNRSKFTTGEHSVVQINSKGNGAGLLGDAFSEVEVSPQSKLLLFSDGKDNSGSFWGGNFIGLGENGQFRVEHDATYKYNLINRGGGANVHDDNMNIISINTASHPEVYVGTNAVFDGETDYTQYHGEVFAFPLGATNTVFQIDGAKYVNWEKKAIVYDVGHHGNLYYSMGKGLIDTTSNDGRSYYVFRWNSQNLNGSNDTFDDSSPDAIKQSIKNFKDTSTEYWQNVTHLATQYSHNGNAAEWPGHFVTGGDVNGDVTPGQKTGESIGRHSNGKYGFDPEDSQRIVLVSTIIPTQEDQTDQVVTKHKIIIQEDDKLNPGEAVLVQQGRDGLSRITNTTYYNVDASSGKKTLDTTKGTNGKETTTTVLNEAQDEIIRVGKQPATVNYYERNNDSTETKPISSDTPISSVGKNGSVDLSGIPYKTDDNGNLQFDANGNVIANDINYPNYSNPDVNNKGDLQKAEDQVVSDAAKNGVTLTDSQVQAIVNDWANQTKSHKYLITDDSGKTITRDDIIKAAEKAGVGNTFTIGSTKGQDPYNIILKVPQKAQDQTATLTIVDQDNDNQQINVNGVTTAFNASGKSGSQITFDSPEGNNPQRSVSDLENLGYVYVGTDLTPTSVYDNDTNTIQHFTITMKHATRTVDPNHPVDPKNNNPVDPNHPDNPNNKKDIPGLTTNDLQKTVTRTINYIDDTSAHNPVAKSVTSTVTFTGTGTIDEVTGNLVTLNQDGSIRDQNGHITWTYTVDGGTSQAGNTYSFPAVSTINSEDGTLTHDNKTYNFKDVENTAYQVDSTYDGGNGAVRAYNVDASKNPTNLIVNVVYHEKETTPTEENGKISVIFHDTTTNQDIPNHGFGTPNDPKTGKTGTSTGYTPADDITDLENKGYVPDGTVPTVPTTYPGANNPVNIIINMKHGVAPVGPTNPKDPNPKNPTEPHTPGTPINPNDPNGPKWPADSDKVTAEVTRTIKYVDQNNNPVNGSPNGKDTEVQTVTFTRQGYVDKTTGNWVNVKTDSNGTPIIDANGNYEVDTSTSASTPTWRVTSGSSDFAKLVSTPNVGDLEVKQVLPGDQADGKDVKQETVTPDNGNQTVYVVYGPKDKQYGSINIVYHDTTTNENISGHDPATPLTGEADSPVNTNGYSIDDEIAKLEQQGYVRDTTTPIPSGDLSSIPATYTNGNQTVWINLKHGYTPVGPNNPNDKVDPSEYTKHVKETVHYVGAGDKTPDDKIQNATWTRTLTIDSVTGQIVPNGQYDTDWTPSQRNYNAVPTPEVDGYTPDKTQVDETPVTQEDITKVVTYSPNAKPVAGNQAAQVIIYDDTAKSTLNTLAAQGKDGSPISFQGDRGAVDSYLNNGYVFEKALTGDVDPSGTSIGTISRDNYNITYGNYDNDDNTTQSFTIYLVHGQKPATPDNPGSVDPSELKQEGTATVHYVVEGNDPDKPLAPSDNVQTITWTRHLTVDSVTGEQIPGGQYDTNWTPSSTNYNVVNTPRVPGYYADKGSVTFDTPQRGDKLEQVVTYKPNGKIIPYVPDDPKNPDPTKGTPISGVENPKFPTDPTDPTKTTDGKVPTVPDNYTPDNQNEKPGDPINPDPSDPGKDIYVPFTPKTTPTKTSENAKLTVIDETANQTLANYSNTGLSGDPINFGSAENDINNYISRGYVWDATRTGANNYAGLNIGNFDNDPNQDQTWTVYLKHGVDHVTPDNPGHGLSKTDLQKTVTTTVTYKDDQGKTLADTITNKQEFNGEGYFDKVTGQLVTVDNQGNITGTTSELTWTPQNKSFDAIPARSFDGYTLQSVNGTADPNLNVNFSTGAIGAQTMTPTSANSEINIVYTKKPDQPVTPVATTGSITYVDQTDGNAVLESATFGGNVGEKINYATKDRIAYYESKGYDLVSNNFDDGNETFKENANDNVFRVVLKHATVPVTPDNPGKPGDNVPKDPNNPKEPDHKYPDNYVPQNLNKTVTRDVTYIYADGSQALAPVHQQVEFKGNGVLDLVTGNLVNLNSDGTIKDQNGKITWTPEIGNYDATAKIDQDQYQIIRVRENNTSANVDETTGVVAGETVNPNSQNSTVVITLAKKTPVTPAKDQVAQIIYRDVNDQNNPVQIGTSGNISGKSGSEINYDPSTEITNFENRGYELKNNGFPAGAVFDNDDSKNQTFYIDFVHKTTTITPDKPGKPGEPINPNDPNGPKWPTGTDAKTLRVDGKQTIHYQYADHTQAAPDNVQNTTFDHTLVFDNVTGQQVEDRGWTPESHKFNDVVSPTIDGYHTTQTTVTGTTVTPDNPNQEITVIYTKNGTHLVNRQEVTASQVVRYVDDQGNELRSSKNQNFTFVYSGDTIDDQTNQVISRGSWTEATHDFTAEDVPVINGYVAVSGYTNNNGGTYNAGGFTTSHDASDAQRNRTFTVVYKKVGKITPVDPNHKPIPNAPTPQYPNDPTDPTKVTPNEPVPTIPNMTPETPSVTPTDPTTDTPVVYNPDKPVTPAKDQVAQIIYRDVNDPNNITQIGTSGDLTGASGSEINYNPSTEIQNFENKGYELKNNGFPAGAVFDNDDSKNQTFYIDFVHKTTTVTPDKPGKPGEPVDPNNPDGPKYPDGTDEQAVKRTGTQTIHYVGAGDKTPGDKKDTFDFTRNITFDNVTGKIISSTPWNVSSHTFGTVETPVVDGYHADKRNAGGTTVTPDDLTKEVTVTYTPNGKIIPVDPNGNKIPDAPTPTYPTDPTDPTKVVPDEPVPNVPGMTPSTPTVTPTDPGKDTPVPYNPVTPAKDQIAQIIYRDVNDSSNPVQIGTSGNVTGASGSEINYDPSTQIKNFEDKGYVLKNNGFPAGAVFDNDDSKNQTFYIDFVHGTVPVTPDKPGKPGEPINPNDPDGPKWPEGTDENSIKKTGTQTIHYVGAGDKTPADNKQDYTFTKNMVVDKVTGQILDEGSWNATSHTFGTVETPVVDGYHADKRNAGGTTVTINDLNKTVTVTYTPNGKIVPVDPSGKPIPNVPTPQYPTDPTDPTKVKPDEPVPNVPGMTPSTPTVTPTDPGKDTPVPYNPVTPAKNQNAVVNYVDADNNNSQIATSGNLSGKAGDKIDYSTATTITDLENKGYVLVNDGFPKDATYDNDDNTTQTYTVVFKHGTTPVTPDKPGKPGEPINPNDPDGPKWPDGTDKTSIDKTVTRTITFVDGNGKEVSKPVEQTVHFTATGEIDNVTGQWRTPLTWSPDQTVDGQNVPFVDGYHVVSIDRDGNGLTNVKGVTLHHGDDSYKVTVTYEQNGKIIPVDPNGKPIPDAPTPTYPTDPKDPSKVTPNEPVPNVPGMTPSTPTVTPTDPGKDTPVPYNPDVKDGSVQVIFHDDTTNSTISGVGYNSGSQKDGTKVDYTTDKDISNLENKGYEYVNTDGTIPAEITGDKNIVVTVHMKHGTVPVTPDKPGKPGTPINPDDPDGPKWPDDTDAKSLTKDVTRTVTYVDENGKQISAPVNQTVHFTASGVLDKVTGQWTTPLTWNDGQSVSGLTSPTIDGYHVVGVSRDADGVNVKGVTLNHNDPSYTVTVSYAKDNPDSPDAPDVPNPPVQPTVTPGKSNVPTPGNSQVPTPGNSEVPTPTPAPKPENTPTSDVPAPAPKPESPEVPENNESITPAPKPQAENPEVPTIPASKPHARRGISYTPVKGNEVASTTSSVTSGPAPQEGQASQAELPQTGDKDDTAATILGATAGMIGLLGLSGFKKKRGKKDED